MGYLQYVTQFDGLDDVSSVCVIDISASKFKNLFSFELDVNNINDICANTLKIKINHGSPFKNILFSQSIVKSGNANHSEADQRLFKDVLRKLSKQVVGENSNIDIFSYNTEMINKVLDLDSKIASQYNKKINNFSCLGYKKKSQYLSLLNSEATTLYSTAENLLSIILDDSGNDVSSYNNLSELIEENSRRNCRGVYTRVNVPFSAGHYLCVRLSYQAENSHHYPQFFPLTYKCLLRLV